MLHKSAPVSKCFFDERSERDDVTGALHGSVNGGEESFAAGDSERGMLELSGQFLEALT